MNIAQITDLHLAGAHEEACGVDVYNNFIRLLDSIKESKERIDHIVITGDLCFKSASKDIYTRMKSILDECGIDYSLVPGNHDDIEMMRNVFHINVDEPESKELYYTKDFGIGKAIFLDTSKSSLSENQKEWLRQELQKDKKNERVLFMHHPPQKVGIAFMDKMHALNNTEELADIFSKHQREIHVFCGHYHAEKVYHNKNLRVFITPSSFFQVDRCAKKFRVGSYLIGWRKITWHANGINTEVSYLDDIY